MPRKHRIRDMSTYCHCTTTPLANPKSPNSIPSTLTYKLENDTTSLCPTNRDVEEDPWTLYMYQSAQGSSPQTTNRAASKCGGARSELGVEDVLVSVAMATVISEEKLLVRAMRNQTQFEREQVSSE